MALKPWALSSPHVNIQLFTRTHIIPSLVLLPTTGVNTHKRSDWAFWSQVKDHSCPDPSNCKIRLNGHLKTRVCNDGRRHMKPIEFVGNMVLFMGTDNCSLSVMSTWSPKPNPGQLWAVQKCSKCERANTVGGGASLCAASGILFIVCSFLGFLPSLKNVLQYKDANMDFPFWSITIGNNCSFNVLIQSTCLAWWGPIVLALCFLLFWQRPWTIHSCPHQGQEEWEKTTMIDASQGWMKHANHLWTQNAHWMKNGWVCFFDLRKCDEWSRPKNPTKCFSTKLV